VAEVTIKGKVYKTGDALPGGGILGEDGLAHAVYGYSPGGTPYVTTEPEAAKSSAKGSAATDDDKKAVEIEQGIGAMGKALGSFWDSIPTWAKVTGAVILGYEFIHIAAGAKGDIEEVF
jgi:hypothetical protein